MKHAAASFALAPLLTAPLVAQESPTGRAGTLLAVFAEPLGPDVTREDAAERLRVVEPSTAETEAAYAAVERTLLAPRGSRAERLASAHAFAALAEARRAGPTLELLPAVRVLAVAAGEDARLLWLEAEIFGARGAAFSPGRAVAAMRRATERLVDAGDEGVPARRAFAPFVHREAVTPGSIEVLATIRTRTWMADQPTRGATDADWDAAGHLDRFRRAADFGDQRQMVTHLEALRALRPQQPLHGALLGMVLGSLGPAADSTRARALLARFAAADDGPSPGSALHAEARAIWEFVGYEWGRGEIEAIRRGATELLVELRTPPQRAALVFPDRSALARHRRDLTEELGDRDHPQSLLGREAEARAHAEDRERALERARWDYETEQRRNEPGVIRGVDLDRLASNVQDCVRSLRRARREHERLQSRVALLCTRIERCEQLMRQYEAARDPGR